MVIMPKKYKKTARRPGVKEYATTLLLTVNYVDIYGRNVGLDYATILSRIKAKFPMSSLTLKELQKTAYTLNGSGTRLPARRRSRKILARDFIRSRLIAGDTFDKIKSMTRYRFPGVPMPVLEWVRAHLVRAGMLPPKKRGQK
jgi:hypothetical protein